MPSRATWFHRSCDSAAAPDRVTAGEVEEQCITDDTMHDQELVACVNQLVAATRYPAPATGSVNVSYPFMFSPTPGC